MESATAMLSPGTAGTFWAEAGATEAAATSVVAKMAEKSERCSISILLW
jgi:hypothetical protein